MSLTNKDRIKSNLHEDTTILIVDDNPANLEVIDNFLRASGFTTLVAGNGEIALKRINYLRPDIILLDLMMPRLNGFDVIEYLHHDPDYCTIPIVAFTAKSLSNDEKMRLERGAFSIMQKQSLEREDLIRELRRVSQARNRKDHVDEENSSRRG